ncbi:hypothetical protein MTR67_040059 [Solanum verrucosum]|uniref:NADH:quinone oxidoreductase/Mrp antiporter transmembrane domain-containing protein n=1 Tax=Solanum verrucosum TaxID=315347 RepID=A0AAF0UIV4_SOLVR|nr:hypothetical protein MTR67_040059 [Solanum verrucosum]
MVTVWCNCRYGLVVGVNDYLSIPTFFMPMLVIGDNSLQLLLGWEGVGLASYLLIHFLFTRLQADKVVIKAMLVNRIVSHTWSPDAMEGPTPVSALIHVATMVTIGVFMLARCSPLFEYPPTTLIVTTFAGAMTLFLTATTGILQNDLKRFIAYSTCSQLPYHRDLLNQNSFHNSSSISSSWILEPVC